MKMQGVSGYYMAPADGYLWLSHKLAPGGNPADGSPEALANHVDQLSVRFIDESEYHENTRLFEGNLLVIPDPRGLEFRHFNGWMAWDASSARNHTEVILQIRQNGAILANLLNREEVQGQASAKGPKPNLDLKCRNAFGKRVSFKWGDWKESNKACLKAYNTEKTHIRDTASAEIWRQIRRHRPYPDDLIYDPCVRSQVDTWPQARFPGRRGLLDPRCPLHRPRRRQVKRHLHAARKKGHPELRDQRRRSEPYLAAERL